MKLSFYKYQGTGNDFVVIDNRDLFFPKGDAKQVSFLCDRRLGIGADGLILLEKDPVHDFNMIYYNADGNISTMCGNGGRCLVAFANYLGIIDNKASFLAIDGLHTATIEKEAVSLQMGDVTEIKSKPTSFFLDTGSPHHVQMVESLKEFNVCKEGAKLRYGLYGEKGSNINFVKQKTTNSFAVRTYERGVEDETLSCGTGVVAVALAMYSSGKADKNDIAIETQGGELRVQFEGNGAFHNIYLTGPAKQVFKGEIEC
ncbi:Diaminopimelate epimerase [hydrothermal vent metagenome]|uniref:diaminopimelate epimerase n=1 Tax=hydrothermal vent metagenome TaxID=652676 RepID=A0A3B0TML3_9ZZZZ